MASDFKVVELSYQTQIEYVQGAGNTEKTTDMRTVYLVANVSYESRGLGGVACCKVQKLSDLEVDPATGKYLSLKQYDLKYTSVEEVLDAIKEDLTSQINSDYYMNTALRDDKSKVRQADITLGIDRRVSETGLDLTRGL